MNKFRINLIAFNTLVSKEITRFLRIWTQTLLPSAITITLYFIIFGKFVGSKMHLIENFSYIQFIAPGLIMMAIITNAYNNVVASFFSMRFQKNIEEILISPTTNEIVLLGFMIGGVLRGLLVGIIVALIALFFTHLHIQHPFTMMLAILLTSTFFSLAGFMNAIFARTFDDISIIPNFVLTPLIYLGGVFYSLNQLPQQWQLISKFNPIIYMVDTFRFSLLGISDVNTSISLFIIFLSTLFLFTFNLYLLNKGFGLKS